MSTLRAIGRRFAQSPGWQLVVAGVVLAVVFPSRLSGTLGAMIVAGAAGVALMHAWPRLPEAIRSPSPATTVPLVITIVVMFGVGTFWETLTVSPDWQLGDWGPQRAVLARAMASMPGFDVPAWNHAVGTGDAPFELYPKLAYLVTGNAAVAMGLSDDLPLALMIVSVIVHIGIAVGTTLLAMRASGSRPIALVVGIAAVVDSGAVAHGGTVGLFRWALMHSAMALMFATIAAVGILAAIARPRLRASIMIWIGTALACATHPAGLIAAVATMLALAAVALLASDVPPRRALVAMIHVAIGVALGAAVWMPLAERLLAYGQHFPNPIRDPATLLENLLAAPSPVTAFAMLSYAGYFGILAGLWSRRASVVFVAAMSLVLLVGLCDAPYLALDLAPGKSVARLGTERLASLARPFLAACGAYAIALFAREAMRGWGAAKPSRKAIAAAIAAVLAVGLVRVIPSLWSSASARAGEQAQQIAPDPQGRAELTRWAAQRASEIKPDAWARAMFESDTHEHFHLTATTNLPTFHLAPQPDLLLRERIEDSSPESLRRFNVKWIISEGSAPALGDPATEKQLGTFYIRELREWDGQFARIERGTGTVRVTALDDTHVEIDVQATEPVLVALGTGYYPRWRATHASGADQPVYAMPSIPTGKLRVVSAWVAPGKTTFTVDGELPSDGKGMLWTILAGLAGVAIIVCWRVRRIRVRLLHRAARLHRRLPAFARVAAQAGVPVLVILLFAKGCADTSGPMRALELGSGVSHSAVVQARTTDGDWEDCGYSRVTGIYTCDGLLQAYDGMTSLLNDARPSWGFNTPGLIAYAFRDEVELRVRVAGELSGTYWMAASSTTNIKVSNENAREAERAVIVYSGGQRTIELRASIPRTQWAFTFVREETIIPPRDFLVKPPETAPAAIRDIR
ncbi:MAG: hypothetical protein M4D80_16370 [Myxococcota bacterium]|nr:hypothetical protein [Myxococcota bacterium]